MIKVVGDEIFYLTENFEDNDLEAIINCELLVDSEIFALASEEFQNRTAHN